MGSLCYLGEERDVSKCTQLAGVGTHDRRTLLKLFAIREFRRSNRCQILVSIATRAVQLVNGATNPADALIGDLEAVLIVANMTDCRGRGPYFAGNISGASGFKRNLRGPYNQVQHAVAGIVIGYRHGWVGHHKIRVMGITFLRKGLIGSSSYTLSTTWKASIEWYGGFLIGL